MKIFKKKAYILISLLVILNIASGCTKKLPDEYYWLSNVDTERVWVNFDNGDSSDKSGGSAQNEQNDTWQNKNESSSILSDSSQISSGSKGLNLNAKVDPADIPSVQNTANLIKPFTVKSDAKAESMRQSVQNAKSSLAKVTGKTYYISYRGSDENDGLSADTPWLTLTKLSYALQIGAGDAVLFERGGVYRGGVKCISGVYYGAYGEGTKPAIYRSATNYAKTEWTKDSDNIWITPGIISDAGIVVFDHGVLAGNRKFSKSELLKNGDYYSSEGGQLYLYMDSQPAKKYTSIEIGGDSHVFSIPANGHDITIDNITMKYGGAMGVQGGDGSTNITITNCEIGWLGGSCLNGYGDGTVRYGNGIEFWNACENIHVENCWIYQIYDSGFSHQGNGANGFTAKDILFTKNLVEYCNFGSIEYWAPAETKHKMVNVEYSNNILRFAGYGWGYYGQPATHIYSTDSFNRAENFVIKNNILDTALNRHVRCIHQGGTLPKLSGNTFIGKAGDRLGLIGISTTSKQYFFLDDTQSAIRADWGDSTAKIELNS